MRKLYSGVAAACLALGGCGGAAPAQVVTDVQADQSKIQTAIDAACVDVNSAMALAAPFDAVPQVAAITTYGAASCGTATAISALVTKAVNDPTTIQWAENLATQIKSALPAKS